MAVVFTKGLKTKLQAIFFNDRKNCLQVQKNAVKSLVGECRLGVVEENLELANEDKGKLEGQVKDLEGQVEHLKGQIKTKDKDIGKLKARLERYTKMTKWEHFKAMFR